MWLKTEGGPWSHTRRPMRDGLLSFAHFVAVDVQTIPLDKPIASLTQQLLRYQGYGKALLWRHLCGRGLPLSLLCSEITVFCCVQPSGNENKYIKNGSILSLQKPKQCMLQICRNTLEQRFPTWGTCTLRGTFAYLKGYI